MMVIVVKFSFACADSCYKALVVNHTAIPFCVVDIFEKLLNLINQIVLLLVKRLPCQYLVPERPAVQQHLYCRIDIANV